MKTKRYNHIGMRTIKTAVSVMLCLAFNWIFCYISLITTADNLFTDILRFIFVRQYPIYACVAAVITMQSTVHDSVKKGISRVIGTLIGGAIGLLFLAVCNYLGQPILDILFATLGVILCIHICNLLSFNDSGPISCVVLLIILVTTNDADPVFYAFDRIFDTIGGIIIAVAVNRFLFVPSFIWRVKQEKKKNIDFISTQKF